MQAINVNVITIFDIDIQVDAADPILTEIEIGEIIRVEGSVNTEGDTIIIVAVNLDPFQEHHSFAYIPVEQFDIKPSETFQVHDLLTDERHLWTGNKNYIRLDPRTEIANVFRVRRWLKRENDFDYFDM